MPLDMLLYVDHMNPRRPIEMFFRGHLWVERVLTSLLVESLTVPDAIRAERRSFSEKRNLAIATGVLDHSSAESLKKINDVRNRLAHEFNSAVTLGDVSALEASLKGIPKTVFDQNLPENKRPLERLQLFFQIVLGDLEFRRLNLAYQRENAASLQANFLLQGVHEQNGWEFDEIGMSDQLGIPDPPKYDEDVWFIDFEADHSNPDAIPPESDHTPDSSEGPPVS
ncbi:MULTISPECIES: hypothetical protein [unclassified Aeromicrobium]|uniref:hypothetical protein n=1 Tax=unclassified Aeromicrobium TaxID=2633570 RepID=UPI00396B07AC